MRRFTAEPQEIRKQVEKMLQAGVIEACHSSFKSGVVLARKKDGSHLPLRGRLTQAQRDHGGEQ
jgi:hypothetical protein